MRVGSDHPERFANPTTSPASLIQCGAAIVPPSVPRSFMPSDLLQMKGWYVVSPDRFERPTTCPWPFIKSVVPKVPPRPPRSSIFLSFGSQKNGSMVGTPLDGFAVKLVKDSPAICPRSLMDQAALSGPPSVPRSCMPCALVQMNACVSVVPG